MDWHIVTGSKGGVGKTLLGLMLAAHSITEEPQRKTTTLILDMNGMNTDTAALLLAEQHGDKPFTISSGEREIVIRATASVIQEQPSRSRRSQYIEAERKYLVGHPLNPFELHHPESFQKILADIKTQSGFISDNFDMEPLGTIILDTNYHFCNIFSMKNADYALYEDSNSLATEKLTIWFLWTYRQLQSLLMHNNDSPIVLDTALAIERNLTQCPCQLMHTFTPMAMLAPDPESARYEGALTAFGRRLLEALLMREEDYRIDDLLKLEGLDVGDYIPFYPLVDHLRNGHKAVLSRVNTTESRLIFLDTLLSAISLWSPRRLPLNIFPLSIFHHELKYFTDARNRNILSELRHYDLYKNFNSLLKRKHNKITGA